MTNEQTKIAQEISVIRVMQERLTAKAGIINNLERNHQLTWFKPDGTSLSDLELRMPDLYWERGMMQLLGPIAEWSTISGEEFGIVNYRGLADEKRTKLLMKAHETEIEFEKRYFRRQLDLQTFEKYLISAVQNIKNYLNNPKAKNECSSWSWEKYEKDFQYMDDMLREHLATPYIEKELKGGSN